MIYQRIRVKKVKMIYQKNRMKSVMRTRVLTVKLVKSISTKKNQQSKLVQKNFSGLSSYQKNKISHFQTDEPMIYCKGATDYENENFEKEKIKKNDDIQKENNTTVIIEPIIENSNSVMLTRCK